MKTLCWLLLQQTLALGTLLTKGTEVSWTLHDTHAEFQVVSTHTTGWIGLGFSDAGGMKGANIWLYRLQNGQAVLQDSFAHTYGAPVATMHQSVELLNATHSSDLVTFAFRRELTVCDEQHDVLRTDSPVWMIYAFGDSHDYIGKHQDSLRGQQLVDLSGTYFDQYKAMTAEKTTTLSLVSPPISLNGKESTTYCYTFYDLSSILTEKHQIVAEDFVVGSRYTHHLVGYLCDDPLEEFQTPGTVYCNYYRERGEPDVTRFNNTCAGRIWLAWAKGGRQRSYPRAMGKPLGDENAKYLLVETHFANANHDMDQVDVGSGFKLTLTKDLRPIDVGMLTIGREQDSIALPPGQLVTVPNECGAGCTGQGVIPPEGLTILSTQLHMHKRGSAMTVQHIRGDKELTPWPSMRHFDFDFQSYSYASRNIEKLLPGDRLITKCVYDMRHDDHEVYGGYSSEEEMCYNFVEYYPAVQPYFDMCLNVQQGLETAHMKNICPSARSNRTILVTMGPEDMPPFQPFASDATCPLPREASGADATMLVMGGLATVLVFSVGYLVRGHLLKQQQYTEIPVTQD
ncbi:DBH-like monooxygenase protein 1 [Kappamyces sp. JEL0829]|nr:DBH-like monooxygenase protein 1 [Kappamyces sp. JEL0829]